MKAKVEAIVLAAQDEATRVETWADLSNFLFDPDYGLLAKAFPTETERRQFTKTPEFEAIRELINQVRTRTGLIEGATPKKYMTGVDPHWKEKLERRLAEIRAGLAHGVPAAEVFAKIREKYS